MQTEGRPARSGRRGPVESRPDDRRTRASNKHPVGSRRWPAFTWHRAGSSFSLILLSLLVLVGCSNSPTPPEGPAELILSSHSGPPGTPLEINGIELDGADAEELEAWLGDEPTLLLLSENSSISTVIPLFLGSDGWPEPPSEPQTFELRRGDRVIGRSSQGVSVEELEPAPGSTDRVAAALGSVTASYAELFGLIPPLPDTDHAGYLSGALAMLGAVTTEGENSLQAVLDGTAPLLAGSDVDLDFIDALLAASGAVDFLEAQAEMLSDTVEGARNRLDAVAGLCEGSGEDIELACLMQIHTVLKDYAEVVVAPTANTYAHTVGLSAGALALGGVTVPATALIGGLLSIADFVMNKMVPGLLPSKIASLELDIEDDQLEAGEVTESTFKLTAVNQPPPISLLDLADQLLNAIGLAGHPKGIEKVLDKYLEVAEYTLDVFIKTIQALGVPAASADHLHLPSMTWGPVEVVSPRLVTLFSFDPEVAAPLSQGEGLEWEALSLGTVTVEVRTRGAGETAKLLRDHALCRGCVYSGGAFGLDSAAGSAELTVFELTLSATPTSGRAPLTTTFNWTGIEPRGEPVPCTLDPGDGSGAYKIDDCLTTTSMSHTYTHTSRLDTAAGAYSAVLALDESGKSDTADVEVWWHFSATPSSGDVPLDVEFNWTGFDPAGPTLSCTLDPGDGSPAIPIEDCANNRSAQHRYTEEGTFQAQLLVSGGAFDDFRTAQVSTDDDPVTCEEAFDAEAWTGSMSFTYSGSGTETTVYRTATIEVALAGRTEVSNGAVFWTAHTTSGSAEIYDTWTPRDETHVIAGQGEPLHREFVSGGLTLSVDCTTHVSNDVFVDSNVGVAYVGGMEYSGPTGKLQLSGSTVIPVHTRSITMPPYLLLEHGGTYQDGYNGFLELELGPDGMGDASVSWSFSPVGD